MRQGRVGNAAERNPAGTGGQRPDLTPPLTETALPGNCRENQFLIFQDFIEGGLVLLDDALVGDDGLLVLRDCALVGQDGLLVFCDCRLVGQNGLLIG